MSDQDPFDRDELVAAYLDGEASPDDRARVEADPELLERARTLRRVVDMVAEPVMPPAPDVKRAHIAAALAASPTAANVTALATRRRRMEWARMASIAAVVIAVLAVPIVLLSGGDDDDSVATSAPQITEDAGSTAAEAASEPELEAATGDLAGELEAEGNDADAAADDGAAAAEPLAEADIPADAEEEAAEEAAPLPTAEPRDDEGSGGADSSGIVRIDVGQVADDAALAAELEGGATPGDVDDARVDELVCAEEIVASVPDDFSDPSATFVAGRAVIDGDTVEYVAAVGDVIEIRRYGADCTLSSVGLHASITTGN